MQFLRIALLLTCTFDWYMTIFIFSGTKKVPVAASQAFRLYATVIIVGQLTKAETESKDFKSLWDRSSLIRFMPGLKSSGRLVILL